MSYILGIDEVGRGPLAGPVMLGIIKIEKGVLMKIGKISDSKKLTPKKRVEIVNQIIDNNKYNIETYIGEVTAKDIDEKGISWALKSMIETGLKEIGEYNDEILLDGQLKAPKEYINQKTIIKGDEKETAIALASIAAKVKRDNFMSNLPKKYAVYNFDKNKGYGTKEHIEIIKKHGISDIHRKSFIHF